MLHTPIRRRTVLTSIAGATTTTLLAACGGAVTDTATRPRSASPTIGVAPTGTTTASGGTTATGIPMMTKKVTIDYWYQTAGTGTLGSGSV